MPDTKANLLIVDDDPAIRMAMSQALTEIGYGVRCAEDGFSALEEIRREIPQILLSDLHMPGMTGFELLSVVRRRFPEIMTIAMSGAFRGDEAHSGVAADAFYQKGSSIVSLLRMMETLPRSDRKQHNHARVSAPISATIWIHANGDDTSDTAYVTIACPECLRTFSRLLGSSVSLVRETRCIFCRSSIRYAIAEPAERAAKQNFQWNCEDHDEGKSQPGSMPQLYYY